jgi:DNA repair exonuclease SbcCD ATPase subunit
MSTATNNPIAQETAVFNQIREVLAIIVPVVTAIPFVPQDLKNQIREIQTKINAIPTVEQLIQSQQLLEQTRIQLAKIQSDFFALQANLTKTSADLQAAQSLNATQKQ